MKRNTISVLTFVLPLVVLFSACQKDNQDKPGNLTESKGNLVIDNDKATINQRVKLKDEVMRMEEINLPTLKSATEKPRVDLTKNYVFKLVAEVDPPVHEGHTLQATHVKIVDSYAFVTYNTRGDKFLGGLEVFDVSDIKNPQIIWHAVFPDADVSAVDYFNHKLYIVGGTNPDATGYTFESAAFLEVLSLNAAKSIQAVDTIIDISSYAGTAVRACAQGIYATSGSTGKLEVFNHSLERIHEVNIPDARSIDLNASSYFVLQAQPGTVNIFSRDGNAPLHSFLLAGDLQEQAKSGVAVTDKYIFAALNYDGLKVLHLDGTTKQEIPAPLVPAGKLPENYVTNTVTVNDDLVLLANGEAGIYIGGMIEQKNDSVVLLGAVRFGDQQSANFVESKGNVIFVATGLGGLKILSISIDEGVPDDVIPTVPCQTLLSSISTLFPEQVNNRVRYPELFEVSVPKNVTLLKESEVYITFVDEGAGWKNTFGYYTYHKDNPPSSIAEIQKTIVFPNVSKVSEGGGLHSGDMVKLGDGKFPAGTVIGFYLVAEGWKNGLTVSGLYTHYTNVEWNKSNFQQHTLFIENSCNDLVMTFEDIILDSNLSYSDQDFNDIIFTIKDNRDGFVNNAFDTTGIPVR